MTWNGNQWTPSGLEIAVNFDGQRIFGFSRWAEVGELARRAIPIYWGAEGRGGAIAFRFGNGPMSLTIGSISLKIPLTASVA